MREDGTIRGAWGLWATDDEGASASGWMEPGEGVGEEGDPKDRPWLRFDDIAARLVGASRFVAAAYGTRRTAVEVELLFGLHRCQGYRVIVPELLRERPTGVEYDPTPFESYRGRVPGHPMGHDPTYEGVSLRTKGDGDAGEPVEEYLLGLVRRASRAVGVSAPDARLEHYLR